MSQVIVEVNRVQLLSAVIILMVCSGILGYTYALARQDPELEIQVVGVLNGRAEDVPVLFNGASYLCDLELHSNPQLKDTATCEPESVASP